MVLLKSPDLGGPKLTGFWDLMANNYNSMCPSNTILAGPTKKISLKVSD